MGMADKLMDVLAMGASIEYECTDCQNEFESSTPTCPECGSEDVIEMEPPTA